MKTVLWIIASV